VKKNIANKESYIADQDSFYKKLNEDIEWMFKLFIIMAIIFSTMFIVAYHITKEQDTNLYKNTIMAE
jgi:hypothetical protein